MSEQHVFARVDLTVPIPWSSGATLYVKLARDLDSWAPTAKQWDDVLEELKQVGIRFAEKDSPIPRESPYHPPHGTREPTSYSGPPPGPGPPSKKTCSICRDNGFPDIEIKWPTPFKPGNRPLDPEPKVWWNVF